MSVFDRFRLDGKPALITGGSRGLGRAMAVALAEAGADLVLVDRERDSLEAARRDLAPIGRRVDLVPADLTTPGAAHPMARLGEPEENGPLALYLASDASSHMTGAAVVIDGGYTLW
jgi:NAD(P)-dependent dehydrogenase (short-subunit alcohol dehydrogenase family)